MTAQPPADPTSIPNPVQSAALARPSHPALVADDGTWTAVELRDDVSRLAGIFARLGIGVGTRVALVGPPSGEWVVAWHALGWVGAVAAPLPPDAPEAELVRYLAAVAPEHVLTTSGISDAARKVLEREAGPRLRGVTSLPGAGDGAPERFWPWEELRALVLTSGTTSAPRLVPITTAQWVLSAFGSAVRLGHDVNDRWLLALPLHHVGGLSMLMRCALYGITAVLHPRFVATRVARALEQGDATLVSLVPTMLERVLEVSEGRPFPPSLRAVLVGGAATSHELRERCRNLELPVALTWGMSEAASQVATRFVGDLSEEAGAGPPLAFARVAQTDGALRVLGPLVGGSLQTRDRGTVDTLGRVHLQGRDDDVIVSGGENIGPDEIEEVLEQHAAVREACVVAIPDARWGERPVALLVQRPGAARPSDAALVAWCRDRLAAFKVPEHFYWREALPRDELGKRSRSRIKQALARERPELFGDEPGAPQSSDQLRGHRPALVRGKVEDCMHELCGGTNVPSGAHELIAIGDGALPDALDLDPHRELLAPADRLEKVRLRVHQGRPPAATAKRRVGVHEMRRQQLLVGLVTVLEDAAVEEDAGTVHLEETRRDLVLERHEVPAFVRWESVG